MQRSIPETFSKVQKLLETPQIYHRSSRIKLAQKILKEINPSQLPNEFRHRYVSLSAISLKHRPEELHAFLQSHRDISFPGIHYARLINLLASSSSTNSDLEELFKKMVHSTKSLFLPEHTPDCINALMNYALYSRNPNLPVLLNHLNEIQSIAKSEEQQKCLKLVQDLVSTESFSGLPWWMDVNIQSSLGYKILLKLAIRAKNQGAISDKQLIELWKRWKMDGFVPDLNDFNDMLSVSNSYQSDELMVSLIRSGLSPNSKTYCCLFNSCKDSLELLLKHEADMQAKGVPHSSESILVIIEVLCNMKEFDEAFGRYEDMKSLGIPRDLSFYHQLFRICARQQPSSDYAILELRYQLKREKNIRMNAETIKVLLDCCITSKNSEVAGQLWQICLDRKEKISKGILNRMRHFWTKDHYQEMKKDWIY